MQRLRKDFFEGEGSRKRLFIFDSCYSGDYYGPRYRDEADPVQGYIKYMLDSSSVGRVALSSCLPIQKAVEDPAIGHGRFTYYLLEALSGRDHEALRRDGCVTVSSLFEYIAKKLPPEQRPVLSGVQQDIFELVCYSDKVERDLELKSEDLKLKERETRLRAMLADHSSFLGDRLSSFVGRKKELVEIRQHIADKQPTGGYVTITGQAGQGKSSTIAKLVEAYGPKDVAFHFIPFNPGPDHQVGLLRNLMARLILKYDLLDIYVASESRPALRDYFPKVLGELAAKGGREVIFIDGLDQLEEDANGVRDLAFLPNDPPRGVVFVLGTRPNDTLRPLELLKPRCEYQLPELSREDFDLILRHRHVQLDKGHADQFYQAMQGNALFLDLLGKELAARGTAPPEKLVKQLAHNPEHLFSLAMTRLKRQRMEWREVIKPVLGVLLVAREPLGMRHMRQILGVDDDRLREGVERLGGLIVRDWQQRYSLFHLKLYEYLRQDEQRPAKEYIFATDEEEGWHKRLAQWCEESHLLTIWQDIRPDPTEQRRREYARQHYLTHLYYAGERQHLFEVLDTTEYGKAKIRDDPSTRSFAQDLDLGRQAAAWEGWTLEEGIALLPRLWQYTLLRCSLTSRADRYPVEAFRLLALLNRKREALGLAELLTKSADKVRAFLEIAGQLREQPDQEGEWLVLLLRAYEIARTIEGSDERARALKDLAAALAQAQQWERAQALWAEAQAVIGTMERSDVRARALGNPAAAFAQAQQWEQAQAVIGSIEESYLRARALEGLATALVQAGQWERAQTAWKEADVVIDTIEHSDERAGALGNLAAAFAQAQQWERAQVLWAEAQAVIGSIEGSYERARTLRELAAAFAQTQQWQRAQAVIDMIERSYQRAEALKELAATMAVASEHGQLLRLVQRSWWLANTREDALQLFSLATEFIPRDPELGPVLHEAFTRVDTFLKG